MPADLVEQGGKPHDVILDPHHGRYAYVTMIGLTGPDYVVKFSTESFEELDREFDLVTCLEVLEHVNPRTGVELLRDCIGACRVGGHVLASVPNTHAAVYQDEFTHQTAYTYADLSGLMSYLGLEVIDGRRVFLASTRHRIVHQYLAYPLHRLLRIDF